LDVSFESEGSWGLLRKAGREASVVVRLLKTGLLFALPLLAILGCRNTVSNRAEEKAAQTVEIEVVAALEHLGHNFTEEGLHSVWCDGCRARLVPGGEPFVIYWINNRIKDTSFRFVAGRKYTVRFTGELKTGVMAYEGKCVDIGQVEQVEEK
jgi:hypothetical protein